MGESFINDICTYKRGGWCTSCGSFGNKVVKTEKTWERKKDGLFGNVWRRKVTWKCQKPAFKAKKSSSNSDGRDTTLTTNSKLSGVDELQVGNFTEGGRVAGCAGEKRLAEDSYEPRIRAKRVRL